MKYPQLLTTVSEQFNKNDKTSPIFFIAEVGTGHGGDFEIAKEMIDECVVNNVAAVKFQHVIAKEILHPLCGTVKLGSVQKDLFDYFVGIEKKTDLTFWKKVKDYCTRKKILFLSSFFGSQSFHDLSTIESEAYKIASPEMNYYQLWEHLQSIVKPVFFSSGVATQNDIEHLFSYFKRVNFDLSRLVHLHCITAYPAPLESYNLLYTKYFEEKFNVISGLSDHSNHSFLIPLIFTALKARNGLPVVLEKHFTLSKLVDNIDDSVAINENELAELIPAMHKMYYFIAERNNHLNKSFVELLVDYLIEVFYQKKETNLQINGIKVASNSLYDLVKNILGTGKKVLTTSELTDYPTTKRSLLAISDIKVGEKITQDNSRFLRSEKNLKPGLDYTFEDKVWGAVANKNIANGEGVTTENISF